MRRLAALALLLPALGLTACGGDDDTTSIPEGPTGTSGVQGPVESEDVTVEEFLAAPTSEQLGLVEDAAAGIPDCDGLDTSPGSDLQVAVAIDATVAEPETPLAEIVADACAKGG
jgi:hypothetical protein